MKSKMANRKENGEQEMRKVEAGVEKRQKEWSKKGGQIARINEGGLFRKMMI